MSKLQEIENALLTINEAVFQNLCDAFLFQSENDFTEIHRVGSQTGKQKTTKGTPDSYFTRTDGKYVFIEYTTKNKNDNKKAFLDKLENDLKKCLNSRSTKIPQSDIAKIILCYNSKLLPDESRKLFEICRNIPLKLLGIDTLALAINGRYQFIAKDYLGIAIDSGQILPVEKFVNEYQSSGFATPLDNKFLFRESELNQVADHLSMTNVLIITGAPGVGKSKLALKAMEKWKEQNSDYITYCISNKNAPSIFDDFKVYFENEKKYLVLLDDANRQAFNFVAILSLIREKKCNIKLIATVRDYAYSDVYDKSFEFQPQSLEVGKFTDEQLKAILESPDFEIRNTAYQKRIFEIADGNPRLALMAARVAIESQNLVALIDVSDLYDKYFQSIITDNEIFTNKAILKTIGIVAFFFTIDIDDNEFCDQIFRTFEIDYYSFNESVGKLEQLELIELSEDLKVIKIADQVLSTYFFYRTFFKDRILNFKSILEIFFDSHINRIKDTIIPANNTFGYENVYEKTNPYLSDFWNTIKENEEKAFKFLELFWFYRQTETLSFIYDKIESCPRIENPSYKVVQKSGYSNFNRDKNQYLNLLTNFYRYPFENLRTALDLSFEYLARNPEVFSQIIEALKEYLQFEYEDERSSFYRQKQLFESLLGGVEEEKPEYLETFFEIIPFFMKSGFHITKAGRKANTITTYQYILPGCDPIFELRKQIWQFFLNKFEKYPDKSINFILEYTAPSPDTSKDIYEFDFQYLHLIFDKYFNNQLFEHCFIVQETINWFKRLGITNSAFSNLKDHYRCQVYKWFCLLSWNLLRDKEDLDYGDIEIKEYDKLKQQEIIDAFQFSNLSQFTEFYSAYLNFRKWKESLSFSCDNSFDIVIVEHFKKDHVLGIKILSEIITNSNPSDYVPYSVFNILQLFPSSVSETLYNLIKPAEFNMKHVWILRFIDSLPINYLTSIHYKDYFELLQSTEENLNINFDAFEKFIEFNPNVYVDALSMVVSKNESSKAKLHLNLNFFKNHFWRYHGNIDLIKKAYIQQDEIYQHFDYNLSQFFEILRLDETFLIDYLNYLTKDGHNPHSTEFSHFGKIWDLPNADALVNMSFNYFEADGFYWIKEEFNNAYFKGLTENQQIKANQFLNKFIEENCFETQKMEVIFNIIRKSQKAMFTSYLKKFLILNSNIETFKQLSLLDSFFSGSYGTIWADVRANELSAILRAVESLPQQLKYLKHKAYLQSEIDSEKRSAAWERKRLFIENRL